MAIATKATETASGTRDVARGGHGIKVVVVTEPGADPATDPLVTELGSRFEVFAVAAPEAVDAGDDALALDDTLTALGLTNVPLVGVGAGAAPAAELAATNPARVAKLVLVAPVLTERAARRAYRIGAPTRVVHTSPDHDAAAFVAAVRAGDEVTVSGTSPVALADAVEAHLRAKAPGANDGLLIRHIDDLEWHEVRVMLVNGVRSVVKNRFVDFGQHRTICHTWYDPGIALAKHSHFAEELIYVLQGGFFIDDIWCPEGTVIVLEPGTYFGPLIAGPEGAYLLEAFPGIGVRAGQDRDGWEERAKELGVEPLPDPPFNPPVTA